ncbi:hypothetical protein GCM10018952_17340 [Streptosporangium vulgare]
MAHAEQVGLPVTRPRERLHRAPRIGTGVPTVSVPTRKTGTTISRHRDVTVSNVPTENPGAMPRRHLDATVSDATVGNIGAVLNGHPDITLLDVPTENPGTRPRRHLDVTTGNPGTRPCRHPGITVLSTRVRRVLRAGSALPSIARHRRLSRRSQRRRHIAEPSSARRRTGPSQ